MFIYLDSDIISLNPVSGNVYTVEIAKIDRDARKQEMFNFQISAYKETPDQIFETINDALIVIDDINDSPPVIELEPNVIEILENTYLTLDFDTFTIDDADLVRFIEIQFTIFINKMIFQGENAQYSVILSHKSTNDVIYSDAFNLIPDSGYQRAEFFKITVIDASLVDYEVPEWQEFELTVIANDQVFETEKTFTIKLINWNDELPIFSNTDGIYTASIHEIEMAGFHVQTVQATDRDIGDTVE